MIDKTLLEQMSISEIEIFDRMALLNLTTQDLDLVAAQKKVVEAAIEDIVEEFYRCLTQFDEIALVIGDSETMRRLRTAQRRYIVEMFSGYYDAEYVNSRLRIGLVHKRIGVEPKLFLASVRTMKQLISQVLEKAISDPATLKATLDALEKLFYFDVTLVFDTYIETLMSEVNSARRRAEVYAQSLEEKAKVLGKHAERDALTGIYNKRGMEKILSNELRMAQRRHTLLCVIYLDINKFKQINDTHGHAKGDEALKELADSITGNIRGSDFPCRVGGDEFCVILPDCERSAAVAIAERIAEAFSRLDPEYSVSIGVAETGVQEYVSEEVLLSSADKLMYEYKSGGAGPEKSRSGGSKPAAGSGEGVETPNIPPMVELKAS